MMLTWCWELVYSEVIPCWQATRSRLRPRWWRLRTTTTEARWWRWSWSTRYYINRNDTRSHSWYQKLALVSFCHALLHKFFLVFASNRTELYSAQDAHDPQCTVWLVDCVFDAKKTCASFWYWSDSRVCVTPTIATHVQESGIRKLCKFFASKTKQSNRVRTWSRKLSLQCFYSISRLSRETCIRL